MSKDIDEPTKILVTGMYGFIATNFFQFLAREYPNVICYGFDKRYEQDITNTEQINKAVEGKDLVFHLAACTHVDKSIPDPYPFHWNNYIGTFRVLEACRKHNVKMINISTSEVYGTAQYIPQDEKHPLNPQSPYAASKTAADRLCYANFITYEQDVVTVRPFNQYGMYQAVEKAIPQFLNNASKGLALPVYGEGKASRDWLFVQDTVSGIWESRKLDAGEVINLCTGRDYTLIELVKIIKDILSSKSMIVNVTETADRPGHVMRLCGDYSKVKKLLGWKPKTSLEVGIRKSAEWYFTNGMIMPPSNYLFRGD